jgi:hypothetical protein
VATDSKTTETVTALRALADLLEANPHLSSPFRPGLGVAVHHYLGYGVEDKKADLRNWARATSHLRPSKAYTDYAELDIDFGGGVVIKVYAEREEVCERVVKGTREVTKTVKDPEALKSVPDVMVTETVEDVEWICRPLLESTS